MAHAAVPLARRTTSQVCIEAGFSWMAGSKTIQMAAVESAIPRSETSAFQRRSYETASLGRLYSCLAADTYRASA